MSTGGGGGGRRVNYGQMVKILDGGLRDLNGSLAVGSSH